MKDSKTHELTEINSQKNNQPVPDKEQTREEPFDDEEIDDSIGNANSNEQSTTNTDNQDSHATPQLCEPTLESQFAGENTNGGVSRIPRAQEKIRYRTSDADNWTYAKVISKGGKSSGKNKFYMNILNENTEDMLGIHLNRVEYEIIKENDERFETNNDYSQNEEVNVTMVPHSDHENPEVRAAKQKELENWKTFRVYTETPDMGQKTISTRWVITKKEICDQETIKARIVVRGFEEEGKIQADSPTASKSTLRMVMAIAASKNWKIETIDIKAAFYKEKILNVTYLFRLQKISKKMGSFGNSTKLLMD